MITTQIIRYFVIITIFTLTIISLIVIATILITWGKESIDRFWENMYKRR